MSLLLHEVQRVVLEEFELEAPMFRREDVTADDMRFMTRECATASPFDPENRRQDMLLVSRWAMASVKNGPVAMDP